MPIDYDDDPRRYRLGMQNTRRHSALSLYDRVALLLGELQASAVLDVGCAEGVLRAALPPAGPTLVGLDRSETLLRAHPPPVVRADAALLPFRGEAFDAVTALNVLYHLSDPMPAIRETHRVLRVGGHLVAAAIARDDSPEFRAYWTRPATTFDADDAPDLVGQVFGPVRTYPWDARLVTLPDAAAILGYLAARQVAAEVATAAARELPAPLHVTKRGALIVATRHGSPSVP